MGQRRGSVMAGLLATAGRVEPGEEFAEQVAELALSLRRQEVPEVARRGRRQRRVRARGGTETSRLSDMRLLR